METKKEKQDQTVFKEKETKQATFGLDENVAALLTYAIGFISGIVFIFAEKENRVVKFHAFQSTILFLPGFVVYLVLVVILTFIPIIGFLLSLCVWFAFLATWIFLMVKAYQGGKYKLPVIGDIAEQQANK